MTTIWHKGRGDGTPPKNPDEPSERISAAAAGLGCATALAVFAAEEGATSGQLSALTIASGVAAFVAAVLCALTLARSRAIPIAIRAAYLLLVVGALAAIFAAAAPRPHNDCSSSPTMCADRHDAQP